MLNVSEKKKGKGYNSIKATHFLIESEYLTDEKTFQDYRQSLSEINVYILLSKESSTGVKESR